MGLPGTEQTFYHSIIIIIIQRLLSIACLAQTLGSSGTSIWWQQPRYMLVGCDHCRAYARGPANVRMLPKTSTEVIVPSMKR